MKYNLLLNKHIERGNPWIVPSFRENKIDMNIKWRLSCQFSSFAQSCPTLCYPMNRSMPGLAIHHQLLKSTQTHVHVIPSSHLILCCTLLLLPPILPSIRVFSNESTLLMRWPKYWGVSASTSVLPVNTQGWSPLGWTGWIF